MVPVKWGYGFKDLPASLQGFLSSKMFVVEIPPSQSSPGSRVVLWAWGFVGAYFLLFCCYSADNTAFLLAQKVSKCVFPPQHGLGTPSSNNIWSKPHVKGLKTFHRSKPHRPQRLRSSKPGECACFSSTGSNLTSVMLCRCNPKILTLGCGGSSFI